MRNFKDEFLKEFFKIKKMKFIYYVRNYNKVVIDFLLK